MMTEDDFAEYTNGPDQIIPVNNMINWRGSGAVKLRTKGSEQYEPISVPGMMERTAKKYPNTPAMKIRDPKTKAETVWTWSEYREEVRAMAKAFIEMGLGRHDAVCVLGHNSPEWNIADLAAIHAGGLAAGIYPSNGPDACRYILENSNCRILVVEDQKQIDKIWGMRNEISSIEKIIQYTGVPSHPGVLSWKDAMSLGKSLPNQDLEARLRRIAINQACTLVYTSGTTGNPKGVMLSHDNMIYTGMRTADILEFPHGNCRLLGYLPLSHVAAQMTDIIAPLVVGGTLFIADKNALKGTLKDNLIWCRPTAFVGVPRVWEKIMEKMLELGRESKGIKKKIATAAKETSLKYHDTGAGKEAFGLFDKIVYKKIKKALGLDACTYFISGAAPLDAVTARYFLSLNIKILELYGMSETSGPHTLQTHDNFKQKSVGTAMPTFKSKLVTSSNEDIGGSELWMWGRNVMMGYLNREDATRKDMTEDGWMKSGDIAVIDSEGFHFITGREKDLIITAGGENIPPQPIHDQIKEELPVISQVLLLGDKQKFLSCFLTLAVNVDPETMEPSRELTMVAKDWCRSIDSSANTVDDILRRPDARVMGAIQAGIDRVNKAATSNAQRVQKWMVLPRDFSLPGGELGPTMKVKRIYITKKYGQCIDKIYS